MKSATIISQKENEGLVHGVSKGLENRLYADSIYAGNATAEDIRETIPSNHLRVMYGVYLNMCAEEGIQKIITWRTFYMQVRGYRTIKPNTQKAAKRYLDTLTRTGSIHKENKTTI